MMADAERPDGANGGFEAADSTAAGWGTAFGSGYLLQREIGVGGMGTVWRGWALGEQRAIAVKILHPHLSADQGVVGRFLREGDVLKRLDHPHLVKVHDLVVEGGRLGLVMDVVEGGDLNALRKRRGTLPPVEVVRIGAQVAGALAAAHAMNVVHLDLKPANVLISRHAENDVADTIDVRLTDFGIARIIDSPDQAATTTTYGTPDYMAPETALSGSAGSASDLYALGITLYELIVGRPPHGGGQALAVLARHIERMPKRLPGIPDSLWDVIVACTAREPADRPDATSVAARLAAVEPECVGLPALEPVPRSADFETTSEPRTLTVNVESATVAVPWLAAVAAAAPKPPPEGPFSTTPPEPRARLRTPSATTRRRATLIGAPLVLFAVVIGSLLASGAFAGSPQSHADASRYTLDAPGSAHSGGPGGTASTTSTTSTATRGAASPESSSAKSVSPTTSSPAVSGSTAPAVSTVVTTTASASPSATVTATATATATATDTGWVCRSGGFKVNGALSENPCIRDEDGTLMLMGELKGTYDSPVVVVVRVDFGGTFSSANISKAVTPADLGGKTYEYSIAIGSWAAGEELTCQENVDPASDTTDYEYTANSGDIRTPTS